MCVGVVAETFHHLMLVLSSSSCLNTSLLATPPPLPCELLASTCLATYLCSSIYTIYSAVHPCVFSLPEATYVL